MEDYVSDSAIPLEKVLEDIDSCDAYVGIFAWRYGFIPGQKLQFGKNKSNQNPPPSNLPVAGGDR
tara:strand:- start:337 stop:531 length:195 start_codon:yes stop_codon:yes gene_type:complete